MTKKDFLKTLDIASLISIVCATIFVFAYQFSGAYNLIKFAIIMYTASFLILTVFYGLQTYYVFAKTLQDGKPVCEMTKKDKIFLVTKFVLSVLAFAFTLIILILY